jgi:hypothetical protein
MVSVDQAVPPDVVDRLLWRDAQEILGRHAQAGLRGLCQWCGGLWPCQPRRLAEAAEAASRRSTEAWTTRHDLHGVPSWRADLHGGPSGRADLSDPTGGHADRGITGARRRARATLTRNRYY